MLFRFTSRIKAYTVHEQPSPSAAKDERAEDLIFVQDGFSFFAAVVPPIWMIVNRLWMVLAGYLCSVFGLIILFGVFGVSDFWLSYALLALNIIVGFEADTLVRWTLSRRSWRQIAHVTGETSEECERRFFDGWLPATPEVSAANVKPPKLPGGLDVSVKQDLPEKVSGEVLPPKPKTWRNSMSWRR